MDFAHTLPSIIRQFNETNVPYALIGGLAMALHGIQRATLDADFIIPSDKIDQIHNILISNQFIRPFHNQNVSHYIHQHLQGTRLDFLHAFRPATLDMLERAKPLPLSPNCSIPVVSLEDIIGLKIQASHNDPTRHSSDWSDIYAILNHSKHHSIALDWPLIGSYLSLFGLNSELPELQSHGHPI